jgi:integrase
MARERGENGIKQIENGKWQVRLTYIDSGGKRRVYKRQASTITDAKKLKKDFLKDLDDTGENALTGDRMTFEKLSGIYRKRKIFPAQYVNGRKVAGMRSVSPTIANVDALNAFFSRVRIKLITPSKVEDYKRLRLKTPTKNDVQRAKKSGEPVVCTRTIAAVNRELELLRTMFRFAVREGWISRSPFDSGASVISKADETKRDRTLSFDEEHRLLEAARRPRLKHLLPIILTALDTAMRRGELFKLQWKDVDLQTGLIFIQATNTKTQTERVVGITPRVHEALTELQKKAVDKNALVFGITDSIKNGWKSICAKAGIDNLNFHDLRHTAITRMVNEGLPSAEIMKTSGHTQMTTFQRYVNPTAEIARRNAERLARYNDAQMKELDSEETDFIN